MSADSPFVVRRPRRPGPRRLAGGARGRGLPAAGRRRARAGRRGGRPGDRRTGVGAAVLARVRLRRHGRHRRPRGRHRRRRRDHAGAAGPTSRSSTPATRCRPATTPSSCASTCTTRRTGAPSCAPPCRPTSTSARSARTSAPPSCCCPRATGCARSTSPRAPRPASSSWPCAARPGRGGHPDRRRDPPGRHRARPRARSLDTNSLMLAAQAARGRLRGPGHRRSSPTTPTLITAAVREAAADADLVMLIAGLQRGPRRLHRARGRRRRHARRARRRGAARAPGRARRRAGPATPVLGAPGYPVSAALTFDIFAAPLLAELEGAAPRERPSTTARLARKLPSAIGIGRLGPGPARPGRRPTSWRRRCRAAPAC